VTEAVFSVELLGPKHDRAAFDCGVPILTSYLQQYARQDLERGVATPYVLVPSTNPIEIAGFYTLTATAVKLTELPTETIKKLPKYPLVPATRLGRLAISVKHRGKGLVEYLLIDALKRSVEASRVVSSAAVIVDAKDESGVRFYERYGFKPLPEQNLRLFIAMKTLAKL
jgi:ribosomal protein S18 acetylase RimI-like enzyme